MTLGISTSRDMDQNSDSSKPTTARGKEGGGRREEPPLPMAMALCSVLYTHCRRAGL